MESLDNLEPYDDLKDRSYDVDLFMNAMVHPPHIADALWELVKLKMKKGAPKAPRTIQQVDLRPALDQRARRADSQPILATLDE